MVVEQNQVQLVPEIGARVQTLEKVACQLAERLSHLEALTVREMHVTSRDDDPSAEVPAAGLASRVERLEASFHDLESRLVDLEMASDRWRDG